MDTNEDKPAREFIREDSCPFVDQLLLLPLYSRAMSQMNRRGLLRAAAGIGAGAALSRLDRLSFGAAPTSAPKPVVTRFPEKTDLILLTDRPPQLETPI